ncbi:MAG: DUF4167 domain-containing protein [Thermaurantiacus sp.]|uniref:DUF4167 domain-containing protein n=1 Tax=Thermaurantiacus sp. TaxID=2820283 RepID=UPI00298F052D|nr:DUF4167 domain-containing protein [Thermaurantiacus sp.]MDW8415852.1 DUF4167 domain-containing protein [Thermaurantiacus sp.]
MNNRQNGRRRRGGGGGGPRPMGMGQGANRLEVRVRGNAHQLLEKYRQLARDAHQAGDRVAAEYYLQHADHYFRVLNDARIRHEEIRARRGLFDPLADEADDEDLAGLADGSEPRPLPAVGTAPAPEPEAAWNGHGVDEPVEGLPSSADAEAATSAYGSPAGEPETAGDEEPTLRTPTRRRGRGRRGQAAPAEG